LNKLIIAIGVGVAMLLPSAPSVAQEMVRLVTHQSYPFHYTENNVIKGNVIGELKCAFNRLGLPYRVEMSQQWRNSLLLQDGKVDGLVTTVSNKSNEDYGQSSKVISIKNTLWFNIGAPLNINNQTAEYKKFAVAAIFGSEEWYSLKKEGYNISFQPRNATELIQLLLANKVDAIVSTQAVVDKSLRQNQNFGVNLSHTEYKAFGLKLHFSNDFIHSSPNFLAKFDYAIDNCILTSSGDQ